MNAATSTMASVWSLICPVWMLLCFPLAMRTKNCSDFNNTETIMDHQGQSTTINCHYSKNKSQILSVTLMTKYKLCTYLYSNTSWTRLSCNDNIRLIWIQETEEISFQLENLQINNSGIYTCTVENYLPPPTRCLGEKRIFVYIKASPSVSVSCVKGPDGFPRVLCSSEGFYPADLKQVWLRGREEVSYLITSLRLQNTENQNSSDVSWNYSNNTDGSYSVTSHLYLGSNVAEQVIFYCWVNHSTLNQPIIANISSTECIERKESLTGMFLLVTGISCGVVLAIGLIIAGCYQGRRTYFHSSVAATPLPEPASHSTLGNCQPAPEVYSTHGEHRPVTHVYSTLGKHESVTQVYSTLGDHWPVPCRSNSNDSTSPSL